MLEAAAPLIAAEAEAKLAAIEAMCRNAAIRVPVGVAQHGTVRASDILAIIGSEEKPDDA